MQKTDSEILHDVLNEFKWDPRILETDAGVEVDQAVVTLTGTVESYAQFLAAEKAAHRVDGVRDVANDLKIKLPSDSSRTDTEIAQALRRSLEWSTAVPQSRITSTVTDGWVTLNGNVEFAFQREAAARAAEDLTGVRGVSNLINVVAPNVDAQEIQAEIEAALERRAERTARHVEVRVRDGKVTLNGSVHSWPELEAVVGTAGHTRGVREVENHLQIDVG